MSTCYTESDHAYGLNAQDITSLKRSCFLQRLDISHLCGAFYEKNKSLVKKLANYIYFVLYMKLEFHPSPFSWPPLPGLTTSCACRRLHLRKVCFKGICFNFYLYLFTILNKKNALKICIEYNKIINHLKNLYY